MHGRPFCVWSQIVVWAPCSVVELTPSERVAALRSMPAHVKSAALSKGPGARTGGPKYRFVGIATTDDRDIQGDVIKKGALNWKPFLSRGYINDDHHDGSTDVLGYPVRVTATKVKTGKGRMSNAVAVEGFLFGTSRVDELAALSMAMEGTKRQMGLSVQGPPPERSLTDRRDIVGGEVHHLAMTPWPVNPNTSTRIELIKSAAALAKSMTAGHPGDSGAGSLQPLMPESMGDSNRAYGIASQTYGLDLKLLNRVNGWAPEAPKKIKKSTAEAVVRRRFPRANQEAVDRIIGMAVRRAR